MGYELDIHLTVGSLGHHERQETAAMRTLQEVIVNEHINDLRREAEILRMEQRMRHRTRDSDGDAAAARPGAGGRRARVRLGHWLFGVGTVLSGSTGDYQR
jgi:hypothetical protein